MEDPDRPELLARVLRAIMPFFILVSIFALFWQSMQPEPLLHSILRGFELIVATTFAIEFVIRFIVYPKNRHSMTTFDASHLFLLIDFCAALPLGLPASLNLSIWRDTTRGGITTANFLLLCVVPQLRLQKMLRYIWEGQAKGKHRCMICMIFPKQRMLKRQPSMIFL